MRKFKVEADFEYKGYRCVVVFLDMFHRCGYVALNKGDAGYLFDYDEGVLYDVKCHGGLTYANNKLLDFEKDGSWWIGFDTAHWMDKRDYKSAEKYFGDDENTLKRIKYCKELDAIYPGDEGEIRTLEYCEEECKKIVEQIIKLNKER